MKVKLVVVQGKPTGMEILLRDAKFLIGRGPECHLRPNSERVSRHHCMFVIEDNGVTLRDLGSTNGTVVNGQRVFGTVPVFHEDLIQVGPIGFRIVLDPVPQIAIAKFETIAAESQSVPQQTNVMLAGASRLPQADEAVVEQWLDGDPARASTPPDADHEMLNTKVETEDPQDTQHELPSHP